MDIKVDHVSKAYGEQQILRDLCCVFPEGKTTCIRGRSGCGKTTLIRLLLGLDIPDKGKIEGISDRKISAVFQEDRLCENLSAASNIRLVCAKTISDRELEEAYFFLHAGFHLGCAGKQEWQQRLSEYPQVLLVRNCIMQKYI